MSRLEESEVVDDNLLDQIAQVLKIPKEAIKNFTEEAAVNIISNTFTDNQFAGYTINNNPTFNPVEKLVEVMDENRKLYERLLTAEKEKVALPEKLLDQKK